MFYLSKANKTFRSRFCRDNSKVEIHLQARDTLLFYLVLVRRICFIKRDSGELLKNTP